MIEWSRHLLTGGMKIEEKLEKSTFLKRGTHSHNLSWNILVNMQREIQIPL